MSVTQGQKWRENRSFDSWNSSFLLGGREEAGSQSREGNPFIFSAGIASSNRVGMTDYLHGEEEMLWLGELADVTGEMRIGKGISLQSPATFLGLVTIFF